MPKLGSSPLGLIMSTSADSDVKLGNYVVDSQAGTGMDYYTSLFGREGSDGNGTSTVNFNYNQDKEDIHEISTQSIVEFCRNHPMMSLSYADFAYLKKLGVYPNNRLIIARRFPAPVDDDLINNDNGSYPLATLISWVPDNEDFFDVSFNENWQEADTSFTELLNEASSDRDLLSGDNKGSPLGSFLAQGAAAIPLPGWSEGLQYQIFNKLGLTDLDATKLPTGNPNLIRQAKQRATAPKKGPFAGVQATIKVKMVVEYEQKFINKIDPTGVYYDIIANALAFGTSDSMFMFRSDKLGANGQFADFLNKLGSGDSRKVKEALTTFARTLREALEAVAQELQKVLTGLFTKQDEEKKAAGEGAEGEKQKQPDPASRAASLIANTLFGILKTVIAGVVSKYKVRILGVLDALTGSPSAPWHVTIGNPKRPIFSSGDMLVTTVDVKFGKLLAYNDLPSTITITVNMENARALGSQELFRKLNCGKARSWNRIRLDVVSDDTNSTITSADIDSLGTYSVTTNVGENNQSAANASTPLENPPRQLSFLGSAIQAGAQLATATGSEAEAARAALIVRETRRQIYGGSGGSGPRVTVPPSITNRALVAVNLVQAATPSRPTTAKKTTNKSTNSRTNQTTQRPNQTTQRPRTSDDGPGDMKEYPEEINAIKAHNSIIQELERILNLVDSWGDRGGSILREKLNQRDNPSLCVSVIKNEVLSKLNSKVTTARKWDMVSIHLDIALNNIYSSISSLHKNVSVPFFPGNFSSRVVEYKTIPLNWKTSLISSSNPIPPLTLLSGRRA